MFANARMYAIDAVSAMHWRTLLEWVIAHADVPVEVIDHPPPAPIASLWQRSDLACALMCGYPLSRAAPAPIPLAAIVPSPARYGRRPVYWSDLVVRADSPWRDVDDVIGKRIAFTVEHSQSGYQAARRFFAERAHTGGSPRLFEAAIGPLVTPLDVVQAIVDGDADVGPVDSYAHDLLRRHRPEVAARLRIVASTSPTPIPPFVASTQTPAHIVEALRGALVAAGEASELAATRDALLIARLKPVVAADYDMLARLAGEADALGYARLQ